MAAESRTGIEGLKTKGLGLGCVDDFEDVDTHAVTKLLQFVHQRDIHAAIDIFKQLGHLRRSGRRDRYGTVEDARIDGRGQLQREWTDAADDFRNIATGYGVIARIFALGRKSDIEAAGRVLPVYMKTTAIPVFKERDEHLFCRAGVGRALKNDKLAFTQMRSNGFRSIANIAQVGLVILIQRRGHADDDNIHITDFG